MNTYILWASDYIYIHFNLNTHTEIDSRSALTSWERPSLGVRFALGTFPICLFGAAIHPTARLVLSLVDVENRPLHMPFPRGRALIGLRCSVREAASPFVPLRALRLCCHNHYRTSRYGDRTSCSTLLRSGITVQHVPSSRNLLSIDYYRTSDTYSPWLNGNIVKENS